MTVLKYWDGTEWQPAVVGKQGPRGDSGIVPTSDGNPPNDQTVLWLDEATDASYPTGPKGDTGNTPVISVSVTPIVDNIPTVTISGPAATPNLDFGLPSYLNYLTPKGSFDIYPRYLLGPSMGARTKGSIPFATFMPNVDMNLTGKAVPDDTCSSISFFVGGTASVGNTTPATPTTFITKVVLLESTTLPENTVKTTPWTVIAVSENIGKLPDANTVYTARLANSVTLTQGNIYAVGILQSSTGGAAVNYASLGCLTLESYRFSTQIPPLMAGQDANGTRTDISVSDVLQDDTSTGMSFVLYARINI